MSLEHKAYKGKTYRPRPLIQSNTDNSLIIFSTPWGGSSAAENINQLIFDYFLSSSTDEESTSPFTKLDFLSLRANYLRTAFMLGNDSLYKEDNREEYYSGLEVVVLQIQRNELTIVQVGQPSVLLARPGIGLQALTATTDLSYGFTGPNTTLSPLPSELLGLHRTSHPTIKSFQLKQDDRLILLSRPYVPASFWSCTNQEATLDSLSELLIQDNADIPFWLSVLSPNLSAQKEVA